MGNFLDIANNRKMGHSTEDLVTNIIDTCSVDEFCQIFDIYCVMAPYRRMDINKKKLISELTMRIEERSAHWQYFSLEEEYKTNITAEFKANLIKTWNESINNATVMFRTPIIETASMEKLDTLAGMAIGESTLYRIDTSGEIVWTEPITTTVTLPAANSVPVGTAFSFNTITCAHSWKTYTGFTEKYEYCEKCDHKRS
jgi:hypothetical protein